MTTEDTDTTRWSLPGGTDLPRDELRVQMEVYGETILLRGFESDSAWVRTVSADDVANVFTQHLGFSPGLLPQEALWWNQGETGQVVALWRPPQVWPVALQREAFKPPARLRIPMPGLVFVCSPGREPWAYAALSRPTDPERLFAVRWDGRAYRLVVPPQAGTATSLTYLLPAGVVAEFHSDGSSSAFFSATDDRDEQGFRIYSNCLESQEE